MDTTTTLQILKKLRDHADGKDVQLPDPSVVQATIKACIGWGEALQAKPQHKIFVEVAYDSAQLERLVNYTLARLGNHSEIVSIQYQAHDREQEHHPPYSAMIHYKM